MDLADHHLDVDIVAQGERVTINWKRPEDSANKLCPPQDQIESICFYDIVGDKGCSDMNISIYFAELQNNEDLEQDEESEFGAATRLPAVNGKKHLMNEIKAAGMAVSEAQINLGDTVCRILSFRRLTPQGASQILGTLSRVFNIEADDMKVLAQVAELPVLRI